MVVIATAASLATLLLGALLTNPLVGLGLAGVTAAFFPVVVRFRGERRRAAFAEQLPDTLQLLAGSLRAGYGILQAADAVATEAPSPTAEEFKRLLVETRLGRPLHASLRAMADRLGNEDFQWFVEAVEIHREVGGNLAEILDTVGRTVRDRNRLRRQVKALSAEGRISAVILTILPFAVGVVISIVNPGYSHELFSSALGVGLVLGAAALMVIGTIWLRRTVRIVF